MPSESTPTMSIRLVPGSSEWNRVKELVGRAAAASKKHAVKEEPISMLAEVDKNSLQYKISMIWRKGRPGSLDALNDDILLHVIRYLDTSSLLVFGSLYPRFGKLLETTNVRVYIHCIQPSRSDLSQFDRRSLVARFAATSRRMILGWSSSVSV